MARKQTLRWIAAACAVVAGGGSAVALSASSGAASSAARPAGATHHVHRLTNVKVVRSDGLDTRPISRRPRIRNFSAASSIPLSYHGGNAGVGVTSGTPKVYLVFWGSQWGTASTGSDGNIRLTGDPSNVAPRLESFLKGIGTNNEQWSGVVTQYCEGVSSGTTSCPTSAAHVGYPTGGAYAGVWVDASAAAPAHASQGQLGAVAVTAAAHFNNVTPSANRNAQYLVVSPTGTFPDGFNAGANFCAWHAYVPTGSGGSPYGPLAFTNLPYIPDAGWSCGAGYVNAGSGGTLDGVTIVEGHEYDETLTDETLGAWWDANGQENADRCAWNGVGGTGGAQNVSFATGSFPVQATWSNDSSSCRISHTIVGLPASNFSITASSAPSVRQGATAASTIRTTATGPSTPVTLSTSGVPDGVTASFSTNPIASGSSATLSLTTSYNVPPGHYSIVVTGTATNGATNVIHSVTVPLTITLGKDFSLSGASVSVRQGASAIVHLPVHAVTPDAASVTFSTANVPAGITPTFDVNPVNAGSTANLTVSVNPGAALGRSVITLTGTASSGTVTVTHSVSLTVTVTLGNDFALSASSVTIHRGGASGAIPLTTRALYGTPTISLGTDALPLGIHASWTTTNVTAGGWATLTFSADSSVALGRYAIVVSGTAASGPANVAHSITVYVTVVK